MTFIFEDKVSAALAVLEFKESCLPLPSAGIKALGFTFIQDKGLQARRGLLHRVSI